MKQRSQKKTDKDFILQSWKNMSKTDLELQEDELSYWKFCLEQHQINKDTLSGVNVWKKELKYESVMLGYKDSGVSGFQTFNSQTPRSKPPT